MRCGAWPVCRLDDASDSHSALATPRNRRYSKPMKRTVVSLACLGICIALSAQAVPDNTQQGELQAIISAQFGSQFVLLQQFPLLTGDFNGDGSQDAVFVAALKGDLQGESGRFHLIDPSNECGCLQTSWRRPDAAIRRS